MFRGAECSSGQMIRLGETSVIIATAGTEQKGPALVMGEHKYVLEHTTDKFAAWECLRSADNYLRTGRRWDNPRGT